MRSAVWADEVAAASLQKIDHDEVEPESRVRERLVTVAIGDEAATQIIERANELSQRDPTEYFEAGLNTILDGLRASRGS
jgi:hypothetical protein